MSQPNVHHRCASVDAQISPHDGTPELVEIFDRMNGRAHDAVLGDPEEEHGAACSENASRNEAETFNRARKAETFNRARKAVHLLRVSHLKFEAFANVAQHRLHAVLSHIREV